MLPTRRLHIDLTEPLRSRKDAMTILADAKVAPTYRLTSVLPRRAARTVRKPYVVLALLQALDVALTGIILGVYVGAGREGNPFVSTIFDHAGLILGLAIILVLKLGTVGVLYWAQFPAKIPNAIYGLVIFNNVLVLILAAWSTFT